MNFDGFLHILRNVYETLHTNTKYDISLLHCNEFIENVTKYLKDEESFERRCDALQHCLDFFKDLRPVFPDEADNLDKLGHFIFLECARLVLGVEFHQLSYQDEHKISFNKSINDTFSVLQSHVVGQRFLVLKLLIINYWTHPVLSTMMNGEHMEEERALTYLRSGEYPEIIKLRIEILLSQQCEDLALNLCSWCVRSPVFTADVFVRKTHLLLLYKLGNADFHSWCLKTPCSMLVEVVRSIEGNVDLHEAFLVISQTALIQHWLHPSPDDGDYIKELLKYSMRAECEQNQNKAGGNLLNNITKILQLATTNTQKLIVLEALVELFGSQYMAFCTEIGRDILKRERFLLDSAKIKKCDSQVDAATASLSRTCRVMSTLYRSHDQMVLACLLTVIYLDPDADVFLTIQERFKGLHSPPRTEACPPEGIDTDTYKELYGIIDMLRPGNFNPKNGWTDLKPVLVMQLLEAGYKYSTKHSAFMKVDSKQAAAKPTTKPSSQQPSQQPVSHSQDRHIPHSSSNTVKSTSSLFQSSHNSVKVGVSNPSVRNPGQRTESGASVSNSNVVNRVDCGKQTVTSYAENSSIVTTPCTESQSLPHTHTVQAAASQHGVISHTNLATQSAQVSSSRGSISNSNQGSSRGSIGNSNQGSSRGSISNSNQGAFNASQCSPVQDRTAVTQQRSDSQNLNHNKATSHNVSETVYRSNQYKAENNGYFVKQAAGSMQYSTDEHTGNMQFSTDEHTGSMQYPTNEHATGSMQYPTNEQSARSMHYSTDQQASGSMQYPTYEQMAGSMEYPTNPQAVESMQYPTNQQATGSMQYPTNQQAAGSMQYPTNQQATGSMQYPTNQQAAGSMQYHTNQQATGSMQYPTNHQQAAGSMQYPTNQQATGSMQYPTNHQQAAGSMQYPTNPQATGSMQYPTNPQATGSMQYSTNPQVPMPHQSMQQQQQQQQNTNVPNMESLITPQSSMNPSSHLPNQDTVFKLPPVSELLEKAAVSEGYSQQQQQQQYTPGHMTPPHSSTVQSSNSSATGNQCNYPVSEATLADDPSSHMDKMEEMAKALLQVRTPKDYMNNSKKSPTRQITPTADVKYQNTQHSGGSDGSVQQHISGADGGIQQQMDLLQNKIQQIINSSIKNNRKSPEAKQVFSAVELGLNRKSSSSQIRNLSFSSSAHSDQVTTNVGGFQGNSVRSGSCVTGDDKKMQGSDVNNQQFGNYNDEKSMMAGADRAKDALRLRTQEFQQENASHSASLSSPDDPVNANRCPVCHIQFAHITSLNRHLGQHHGIRVTPKTPQAGQGTQQQHSIPPKSPKATQQQGIRGTHTSPQAGQRAPATQGALAAQSAPVKPKSPQAGQRAQAPQVPLAVPVTQGAPAAHRPHVTQGTAVVSDTNKGEGVSDHTTKKDQKAVDTKSKNHERFIEEDNILLLSWVYHHLDNPYPSERERYAFCLITGKHPKQISNWFANVKRKLIQPKPDVLPEVEVNADMPEGEIGVNLAKKATSSAKRTGGFVITSLFMTRFKVKVEADLARAILSRPALEGKIDAALKDLPPGFKYKSALSEASQHARPGTPPSGGSRPGTPSQSSPRPGTASHTHDKQSSPGESAWDHSSGSGPDEHSTFPGDDGSQAEQSGFRCKFCYKAFPTLAEKRRHQEFICEVKMAIEHEEKDSDVDENEMHEIISCDICKDIFCTEAELQDHLDTDHKSDLDDDSVNSDDEVWDHDTQIVHYSDDVNFACPYCDKNYGSWSGFYAHVERNHNDDADERVKTIIWKCQVCKVTYMTYSGLRGHFRVSHPRDYDSIAKAGTTIHVTFSSGHTQSSGDDDALKKTRESGSDELKDEGSSKASGHKRLPRSRSFSCGFGASPVYDCDMCLTKCSSLKLLQIHYVNEHHWGEEAEGGMSSVELMDSLVHRDIKQKVGHHHHDKWVSVERSKSVNDLFTSDVIRQSYVKLIPLTKEELSEFHYSDDHVKIKVADSVVNSDNREEGGDYQDSDAPINNYQDSNAPTDNCCIYCKKAFKSNIALKQHLKRRHQLELSSEFFSNQNKNTEKLKTQAKHEDVIQDKTEVLDEGILPNSFTEKKENRKKNDLETEIKEGSKKSAICLDNGGDISGQEESMSGIESDSSTELLESDGDTTLRDINEEREKEKTDRKTTEESCNKASKKDNTEVSSSKESKDSGSCKPSTTMANNSQSSNKNTDNNGTAKKVTDNTVTDKKDKQVTDHKDKKVTDKKVTDHKDKKVTDHKDKKVTDHKDKKVTDPKDKNVTDHKDKKVTDKKVTDHKDKQVTDHKDKKVTDKKVTDHKDKKVTDPKDKKVTDHKDKKVTDPKDKKVTDKKVTDHKDKKVTDQKMTDQKVTDKKVTDNKDKKGAHKNVTDHKDKKVSDHKEKKMTDQKHKNVTDKNVTASNGLKKSNSNTKSAMCDELVKQLKVIHKKLSPEVKKSKKEVKTEEKQVEIRFKGKDDAGENVKGKTPEKSKMKRKASVDEEAEDRNKSKKSKVSDVTKEHSSKQDRNKSKKKFVKKEENVVSKEPHKVKKEENKIKKEDKSVKKEEKDEENDVTMRVTRRMSQESAESRSSSATAEMLTDKRSSTSTNKEKVKAKSKVTKECSTGSDALTPKGAVIDMGDLVDQIIEEDVIGEQNAASIKLEDSAKTKVLVMDKGNMVEKHIRKKSPLKTFGAILDMDDLITEMPGTNKNVGQKKVTNMRTVIDLGATAKGPASVKVERGAVKDTKVIAVKTVGTVLDMDDLMPTEMPARTQQKAYVEEFSSYIKVPTNEKFRNVNLELKRSSKACEDDNVMPAKRTTRRTSTGQSVIAVLDLSDLSDLIPHASSSKEQASGSGVTVVTQQSKLLKNENSFDGKSDSSERSLRNTPQRQALKVMKQRGQLDSHRDKNSLSRRQVDVVCIDSDSSVSSTENPLLEIELKDACIPYLETSIEFKDVSSNYIDKSSPSDEVSLLRENVDTSDDGEVTLDHTHFQGRDTNKKCVLSKDKKDSKLVKKYFLGNSHGKYMRKISNQIKCRYGFFPHNSQLCNLLKIQNKKKVRKKVCVASSQKSERNLKDKVSEEFSEESTKVLAMDSLGVSGNMNTNSQNKPDVYDRKLWSKSRDKESKKLAEITIDENTRSSKSRDNESSKLAEMAIDENTRLRKSRDNESSKLTQIVIDENTHSSKSRDNESKKLTEIAIDENTRSSISRDTESKKLKDIAVNGNTRSSKSTDNESKKLTEIAIDENTCLRKSRDKESSKLAEIAIDEGTPSIKSRDNERKKSTEIAIDGNTHSSKSRDTESKKLTEIAIDGNTHSSKSRDTESKKLTEIAIDENTQSSKFRDIQSQILAQTAIDKNTHKDKQVNITDCENVVPSGILLYSRNEQCYSPQNCDKCESCKTTDVRLQEKTIVDCEVSEDMKSDGDIYEDECLPIKYDLNYSPQRRITLEKASNVGRMCKLLRYQCCLCKEVFVSSMDVFHHQTFTCDKRRGVYIINRFYCLGCNVEFLTEEQCEVHTVSCADQENESKEMGNNQVNEWKEINRDDRLEMVECDRDHNLIETEQDTIKLAVNELMYDQIQEFKEPDQDMQEVTGPRNLRELEAFEEFLQELKDCGTKREVMDTGGKEQGIIDDDGAVKLNCNRYGIKETEKCVREEIEENNSGVSQEKEETDNDVREEIKETDNGVTLEIEDTDNGVREEIEETNNGVREEIKETANGVSEETKESNNGVKEENEETDSSVSQDIKETDDRVRQEIEGTNNGRIQEIEGTIHGVSQEIEETDDGVRQEIEETDDGVRQEMEKNDVCVPQEIEENGNGVTKAIEETGNGVREEIEETNQAVREEIEESDSSQEIEETVNDVSQEIEETDNSVTQEIEETGNGVKEGKEVTDNGVTQEIEETDSGFSQEIEKNDNGVTLKIEETFNVVSQEIEETGNGLREEIEETGNDGTQEKEETNNSVCQEIEETDDCVSQEIEETGNGLTQEIEETNSGVREEIAEIVNGVSQEIEETDDGVRQEIGETDDGVRQEIGETDETKGINNDTMQEMDDGTREELDEDNDMIQKLDEAHRLKFRELTVTDYNNEQELKESCLDIDYCQGEELNQASCRGNSEELEQVQNESKVLQLLCFDEQLPCSDYVEVYPNTPSLNEEDMDSNQLTEIEKVSSCPSIHESVFSRPVQLVHSKSGNRVTKHRKSDFNKTKPISQNSNLLNENCPEIINVKKIFKDSITKTTSIEKYSSEVDQSIIRIVNLNGGSNYVLLGYNQGVQVVMCNEAKFLSLVREKSLFFHGGNISILVKPEYNRHVLINLKSTHQLIARRLVTKAEKQKRSHLKRKKDLQEISTRQEDSAKRILTKLTSLRVAKPVKETSPSKKLSGKFGSKSYVTLEDSGESIRSIHFDRKREELASQCRLDWESNESIDTGEDSSNDSFLVGAGASSATLEINSITFSPNMIVKQLDAGSMSSHSDDSSQGSPSTIEITKVSTANKHGNIVTTTEEDFGLLSSDETDSLENASDSACVDSTTPVCVDNRSTPVCIDSTTPVCIDSTTPVCIDSTTPVCIDSTTPVCVDSTTPVCVDSTTPVCIDSTTSDTVRQTSPLACSDHRERLARKSYASISVFMSGSRYVCPLCTPERDFQVDLVLRHHMKFVHAVVEDDEEILTRCYICKEVFETQNELHCHLRWIHQVRNMNSNIIPQRSKDTDSSSSSTEQQDKESPSTHNSSHSKKGPEMLTERERLIEEIDTTPFGKFDGFEKHQKTDFNSSHESEDPVFGSFRQGPSLKTYERYRNKGVLNMKRSWSSSDVKNTSSFDDDMESYDSAKRPKLSLWGNSQADFSPLSCVTASEHTPVSASKPSPLSAKTSPNTEEALRPNQCPVCMLQYSHITSLNQHLQQHHGIRVTQKYGGSKKPKPLIRVTIFKNEKSKARSQADNEEDVLQYCDTGNSNPARIKCTQVQKRKEPGIGTCNKTDLVSKGSSTVSDDTNASNAELKMVNGKAKHRKDVSKKKKSPAKICTKKTKNNMNIPAETVNTVDSCTKPDSAPKSDKRTSHSSQINSNHKTNEVISLTDDSKDLSSCKTTRNPSIVKTAVKSKTKRTSDNCKAAEMKQLSKPSKPSRPSKPSKKGKSSCDKEAGSDLKVASRTVIDKLKQSDNRKKKVLPKSESRSKKIKPEKISAVNVSVKDKSPLVSDNLKKNCDKPKSTIDNESDVHNKVTKVTDIRKSEEPFSKRKAATSHKSVLSNTLKARVLKNLRKKTKKGEPKINNRNAPISKLKDQVKLDSDNCKRSDTRTRKNSHVSDRLDKNQAKTKNIELNSIVKKDLLRKAEETTSEKSVVCQKTEKVKDVNSKVCKKAISIPKSAKRVSKQSSEILKQNHGKSSVKSLTRNQSNVKDGGSSVKTVNRNQSSVKDAGSSLKSLNRNQSDVKDGGSSVKSLKRNQSNVKDGGNSVKSLNRNQSNVKDGGSSVKSLTKNQSNVKEGGSSVKSLKRNQSIVKDCGSSVKSVKRNQSIVKDGDSSVKSVKRNQSNVKDGDSSVKSVKRNQSNVKDGRSSVKSLKRNQSNVKDGRSSVKSLKRKSASDQSRNSEKKRPRRESSEQTRLQRCEDG